VPPADHFVVTFANIMANIYHRGMSEGDPIQPLAANLAVNLRFLRRQRGLTQAGLARLSGLPRSTVGQIETGAGNPTLAVLARLALSLQLSIEEILSSPHARCHLFPRGSIPGATRSRRGAAQVQKLLPDPIPGMEIDRLELEPGTRLTGVPHRPGTREYLTCERGRLSLRAAGERYDLSEGDVAAFDGDQAHSYHNEGTVTAVGFSVVTLGAIRPPRRMK